MLPHVKTPEDVIRMSGSTPFGATIPLDDIDGPIPVDFTCACGHLVMALSRSGGAFVDLDGALCPVCIGSVTTAGDVIAVLNQRRLAALVLKRVTAGGDAGEGKETTNGQDGHTDVHPPEAG